MVAVAENEYRQIRAVAENGFISRRDLEGRESALLGRRQQLSQLQQVRASKSAALAEARRAITQSGVTARAQAASVQSSRAELAQRTAQAEATQGYTLTSRSTVR